MAHKPAPTKAGQTSRDDRLKAALKANLARRKQQARVRAGQDKQASGTSSDKDR